VALLIDVLAAIGAIGLVVCLGWAFLLFGDEEV
jgi:hypothetical protein